MSHSVRFAEIVAQEITSGQLRWPVWQEAQTLAKGDAELGKTLYIVLRVEQMEEDERVFQATSGNLKEQERLHEQTATHIPSRALFVVVIVIFLLVLLLAGWLVLRLMAK